VVGVCSVAGVIDVERNPSQTSGVSQMLKQCAFALTALMVCATARADNVTMTEPPLDPAVKAQLDELLAKQDWNGLGVAWMPQNNPDFFRKSMDWLKTQVDAGGPYFLALLFSRDLWMAGNSLADTNLHDTSAMMLLYTMALVRIDGLACADASAPSHRFEQSLQIRADTWRYLRSLSPNRRETLISIAVGLENHTATLREPHDELLCRGGLAEIQASQAAGLAKEVPSPPNVYGRTVNVTAPPGFKPSYLPDTDYKAKQDEARASLHEWLGKLAE